LNNRTRFGLAQRARERRESVRTYTCAHTTERYSTDADMASKLEVLDQLRHAAWYLGRQTVQLLSDRRVHTARKFAHLVRLCMLWSW
jgi:hypothetical protein